MRSTLAHELTHGLDDQYVGLDRPQYDKAKDEIGFGFDAISEGDARRVENDYVAQMSPADKAAHDQEEQAAGTGLDPATFPPVLLNELQAPYSLGEVFVRALVADGGNAEVTQDFGSPPHTSAEVMDPSLYLHHFQPVAVPVPQADGKATDDGMFGELLTFLTLADSLQPSDAATAVKGWNGDHYVVWDSGQGAPCIRVDQVMKTPAQATTLKQAWDTWASTHAGADIEPRGANGVEVTRCAGGASGQSPV
jgi:hypothetical protein